MSSWKYLILFHNPRCSGHFIKKISRTEKQNIIKLCCSQDSSTGKKGKIPSKVIRFFIFLKNFPVERDLNFITDK